MKTKHGKVGFCVTLRNSYLLVYNIVRLLLHCADLEIQYALSLMADNVKNLVKELLLKLVYLKKIIFVFLLLNYLRISMSILFSSF